MSIETGGYNPNNPNNMTEKSYEEKMQTEREAFFERMSNLAEELKIPVSEVIETYAIEEKNAREENPEEPDEIYEAGPGSKTIEKLIVKSIKSGLDGLTGINNRVSFDQEVEKRRKEVEKRGEFSMIMIDIDKFKKVNDTYGHQAGDYVLREVANTLKKNMRQGDLLARYGGEEMVIIAPNTNGSATGFAERLRRSIEETPFEFEGNEIKVTISAGVAPYDEDFKKMKTTSDMALYLAKGEGSKLTKDAEIEPGHLTEETRNIVWYFDKETNKFKKHQPKKVT